MRLIDADEMDVNDLPFTQGQCRTVRDWLALRNTVDAKPVVHAHWIEAVWGPSCSSCGEDLEEMICLKPRNILKDLDVTDEECYDYVDIKKPYPDYCPCCGAKMDEEVKHG